MASGAIRLLATSKWIPTGCQARGRWTLITWVFQTSRDCLEGYKILWLRADEGRRKYAESIDFIGTFFCCCGDTDSFDIELWGLVELADMVSDLGIYCCTTNIMFYDRYNITCFPHHMYKLFSDRSRYVLRGKMATIR